MSAATDTFACFVDVLAESLDDHDASGEELASRLHLSRFHVDRLGSAAAGEPPATLRRRVLLERAAYRLITTDDVLRVAVEAGYSSHEAFTRAFARAYGEAPSRWRRRPRAHLRRPSQNARLRRAHRRASTTSAPATRCAGSKNTHSQSYPESAAVKAAVASPPKTAKTTRCSVTGS